MHSTSRKKLIIQLYGIMHELTLFLQTLNIKNFLAPCQTMTTLSIFITAAFRTFCHKILQKQIEDMIVKRKYVVTLAECIDTLKKQGKHIFRQQKNCVNNKNIFYTLSSSKASVSYDFCSRVIVKTMVSISGVVVVVLRLIS